MPVSQLSWYLFRRAILTGLFCGRAILWWAILWWAILSGLFWRGYFVLGYFDGAPYRYVAVAPATLYMGPESTTTNIYCIPLRTDEPLWNASTRADWQA